MRIEKDFMAQMINGYISAALFSSSESLDSDVSLESAGFEHEDVSDALFVRMYRDCKDFTVYCFESAGPNIRKVIESDPDQFGVDFWFTRNHHGAGFWDGGWDVDIKGLGQALTDKAHIWGEFTIVADERYERVVQA